MAKTKQTRRSLTSLDLLIVHCPTMIGAFLYLFLEFLKGMLLVEDWESVPDLLDEVVCDVVENVTV